MWKSWLRRATLEQWEAIDREYRVEALPSYRAAAVLVTAAVALILPRYFGQTSSLEKFAFLQALAEGLPYPQMHGDVYWALFKVFNYGFVPWLCMRFVLKEPLSAFGVRFVESRAAALTYLAMLLAIAPFVVIASGTEAFLRTYPKCAAAGDGLGPLLVWELAYGLQFLMLEVFFRGFLIFALARWIGSLAIFVMIIPYAMIHFSKPMAECFGSILAGIALGTVALRTRSIVGGVLVHCVVAWSMDLLALYRTDRLFSLFSG
ncbi:MAG: CPBP family intramembrane glutamic endopeptidase [Polyangiales bacterium]